MVLDAEDQLSIFVGELIRTFPWLRVKRNPLSLVRPTSWRIRSHIMKDEGQLRGQVERNGSAVFAYRCSKLSI